MRMTLSLPVNRKNYWKERSNPSSSSFCKNEDSNSLQQRQSLRTSRKALTSSDKTCADISTENCSSSPPRKILRPSWGHPKNDQSCTGYVCRRFDQRTQPQNPGLGQLSSACGEQAHV